MHFGGPHDVVEYSRWGKPVSGWTCHYCSTSSNISWCYPAVNHCYKCNGIFFQTSSTFEKQFEFYFQNSNPRIRNQEVTHEMDWKVKNEVESRTWYARTVIDASVRNYSANYSARRLNSTFWEVIMVFDSWFLVLFLTYFFRVEGIWSLFTFYADSSVLSLNMLW